MPGKITRPPFERFTVPTHGRRRARYFVFHTTEGGGTIQSLASYFRGTPDGLGVNYITEPSGKVGSNGDFDALTYHVADENSVCIGDEIIAFHYFTSLQWFKRLRQLWAVCWTAAWASQELGIPLRRGAANHQWIAPSGFCEHRDVPNNDHVDCGDGFPFDWVLRTAAKWQSSGVPIWVRLALPKG